jgi:hypothetical protein
MRPLRLTDPKKAHYGRSYIESWNSTDKKTTGNPTWMMGNLMVSVPSSFVCRPAFPSRHVNINELASCFSQCFEALRLVSAPLPCLAAIPPPHCQHLAGCTSLASLFTYVHLFSLLPRTEDQRSHHDCVDQNVFSNLLL